jgi:hypothetical protein
MTANLQQHDSTTLCSGQLGHDWSWPEPFMYTVYDRMYGKIPAQNIVYTPYVRMYVWF